MNSTTWLRTAIGLLVAASYAPAQSGSGAVACKELDLAKRTEIERYVQQRYKLAFPPVLAVEAVDGDCYRKLRFASSNGKGFNLALFLSSDENHLFLTAFDVRVDPASEERLLAEKRRTALIAGAKPIGSPGSSAVAIVVYSDFQCHIAHPSGIC